MPNLRGILETEFNQSVSIMFLRIDGGEMDIRELILERDQEIGRFLRTARKANGLTLKELATILGICYQQVQKYESGQNRISAGTLQHASHHIFPMILCTNFDSQYALCAADTRSETSA